MNALATAALWQDLSSNNPPHADVLNATRLVLQTPDSGTRSYRITSMSPLPGDAELLGLMSADANCGQDSAPQYLVVQEGEQITWYYEMVPVLRSGEGGQYYAIVLGEVPIVVPSNVAGGRDITFALSSSPVEMVVPAIPFKVKMVLKYIKAIDDTFVVDMDPADLDIRINDMFVGYTDEEKAEWSVQIITQPTKGVLTTNVVNGFPRYTANEGESGDDTFRYRLVQNVTPQWFIQAEDQTLVSLTSGNVESHIEWRTIDGLPFAAYPNDYAEGLAAFPLNPQLLVFKACEMFRLVSSPTDYQPILAGNAGAPGFNNGGDYGSNLRFNVPLMTPYATFPSSHVSTGEDFIRIDDVVENVGLEDTGDYYFRLTFTHPTIPGDIFIGGIYPVIGGA